MGVVEVCPKNQVDITTASKKLGCKNDTYGNNRYMCVPKEDKASLIEFCYDGNMGIEEGGACLEASFGGIRRYNCSGFMYGCPDVPFHRYDVHKYPACQDINTKQRCYVLDRSCSSQRIDQRIEKELKEEGSSDIIIYAAIGVFLFIVILAAIFIRKFILKKAPVQSDRNGDGIYEHVTERQEHLDAIARLLPDHGSAAHATSPLPNPNNEAHATRPLPNPYNEAQSTIQVPFYNNEVSSTGPVPFNNNEASARIDESGLLRTPSKSGNAHRLNESVSPNTPFSDNSMQKGAIHSCNEFGTLYKDNSMQKGAIHSCNEFGTLYKDDSIACYEAEEKQKGMKVSIRFKENKADQKENKADQKENKADQKENKADQKENKADQKENKADQKENKADQKENKADQKEQPEEILNKNADMFRLKRDGKLATFKLLYEEDEEQNNDPST